jgi:glucose-6-phosphate 1-dehydrogenase
VGSGIGAHGPDHLTFDLADASKLSLSFYGKRPGPGMKLDKSSLQFALHETGRERDVLEAYERLIHDAMSGDHTLFTTAEGIERLWELSIPLLDAPRPCAPTPRDRGDRTRYINSWPHTRGTYRSNGRGGPRRRGTSS